MLINFAVAGLAVASLAIALPLPLPLPPKSHRDVT